MVMDFTLSTEQLAKFHATYVQQISSLIKNKSYDYQYVGDFGKIIDDDFASDLADKLISIQKRFEQPGWWPTLDVSPGWYRILADWDDCMCSISPEYTLHQIKSKFAGLRLYYGQAPNHHNVANYELLLDTIVSRYEDISYRVCETCGDQGIGKQVAGWVWTLCDKCYQHQMQKVHTMKASQENAEET